MQKAIVDRDCSHLKLRKDWHVKVSFLNNLSGLAIQLGGGEMAMWLALLLVSNLELWKLMLIRFRVTLQIWDLAP